MAGHIFQEGWLLLSFHLPRKVGGGKEGGASSYLLGRVAGAHINSSPSLHSQAQRLPSSFQIISPLIIFVLFSELRYCRLISRRWGKAGKWCRDWLIINSIGRYWTFLSQTLPIIANHCPTHVMKLCSLKSSTQRCVSKIKAEKEDQHNELILSSLSRTWQYGYF